MSLFIISLCLYHRGGILRHAQPRAEVVSSFLKNPYQCPLPHPTTHLPTHLGWIDRCGMVMSFNRALCILWYHEEESTIDESNPYHSIRGWLGYMWVQPSSSIVPYPLFRFLLNCCLGSLPQHIVVGLLTLLVVIAGFTFPGPPRGVGS